MEPSNDSYSPEATAEIRQLQQQLQLRDQLVDQLSFELFQAMQAHPPLLVSAQEDAGTPIITEPPPPQPAPVPLTPKGLRQQVQVLEEQVEFYKQQVDHRDTEIHRLQKSCQSLSDRNHVLERMIQELPEVYRQRFADRLEQVKNKVQSLQLENQRLSSQVQGSVAHSKPTTRQGLSRLLPASWQGSASKKMQG